MAVAEVPLVPLAGAMVVPLTPLLRLKGKAVTEEMVANPVTRPVRSIVDDDVLAKSYHNCFATNAVQEAASFISLSLQPSPVLWRYATLNNMPFWGKASLLRAKEIFFIASWCND